MKQLTVILFMVIYLLSLAGNSLYLEYLMLRSNEQQNTAIDRGKIDRHSLVEIKVPFKAPYYSSSPGYERYYGEINIDGHYYTYVERKVSNDTIYMLCLPDHQKSKLQKAKTQLAINDEGFTNKKTGSKDPLPIAKKSSLEYDEHIYMLTSQRRNATKSSFNFSYTTELTAGIYAELLKPPGPIIFT